MKTSLYICTILLLTLSFTSCKKKTCVEKRIENHSACLTQVDEYKYKNQLVYLFKAESSSCADAQTELLDADCNLLCSWGGWLNDTECRDDFYKNAKFQRTLWKGKN